MSNLTAERHEFIAEEMRSASRGSFPLSPRIMDGHYLTAHLYWHYRRDLLSERSIIDIFGTREPEPPKLQLPKGHIPIFSLDGLNERVWE